MCIESFKHDKGIHLQFAREKHLFFSFFLFNLHAFLNYMVLLSFKLSANYVLIMIYHLKIEIERAFQEIIERAGCKYTNVTFSLSDIVLKTEGITLYNDK